MINYFKDVFLEFKYGTLRNDNVKGLLTYDFILVDGPSGSGKTFLAEKLRNASGDSFQIFEEHSHPTHSIDYYKIGQLLAKNIPCLLVMIDKLNLNHLPHPVKDLLRAHNLKIIHVSLVENRRYKSGPLYLARKFK